MFEVIIGYGTASQSVSQTVTCSHVVSPLLFSEMESASQPAGRPACQSVGQSFSKPDRQSDSLSGSNQSYVLAVSQPGVKYFLFVS